MPSPTLTRATPPLNGACSAASGAGESRGVGCNAGTGRLSAAAAAERRRTAGVAVRRNEARSALSDLDRAEAALRLKSELSCEAGSDVPWAEVEARLGLGESRRMQLQRLYERLPPEARPLVRRFRWPERTLRPLHSALFAKQLPPEQASGCSTTYAFVPSAAMTVCDAGR